MRRIGVLINLSENDLEAQRLLTTFREELARLGWVDGRNLRIDYRWASGDIARIRIFAKELVQLSPDISVGYATPSVGLQPLGVADGPALFRLSAKFVHRILRGGQPNDLPIEQPTKV